MSLRYQVKPEKPFPRLHIGTSGWSYRHWSGVFYPENTKPAQYLEYYATQFDCVELNSSFYHLPLKMTTAGWMERTPANFLYCPKLSRYITHLKRLKDTGEALSRFFEVFEVMRPRLGPILIQLPPGLHFNQSLIRDFLYGLTSEYPAYRFAIETRHKSWLTDDCFELLKQYKVAFVVADAGKRFPYSEAVTANDVYLRFHGRETLYASDYTEEELRQYAGKIIQWLSANHEVWAFFNNDFHGFAVKNAKRLKEMVEGGEYGM